MEVWVRSQDKEMFQLVDSFWYTRNISFAEYDNDSFTRVAHKQGHGVLCNGICFGEYATKERCLEIIDEIQKLLCQTFMIFRNLDITEDIAEYLKPKKGVVYQAENQTPQIEYHEQSVVVYEMPKE